MKRFLPLIVVAVLAGAVAFGVTKWFRLSHCPDETTWLKNEFALSPQQLASIEKLRADYAPVCAAHCRQIAAAEKRLAAAEKSAGISSEEFHAAQAKFDAVSQECVVSTQRLLEAIAAQMDADQGRRYLAMVAPKLSTAEDALPPATK
jgi:hypothetical protein